MKKLLIMFLCGIAVGCTTTDTVRRYEVVKPFTVVVASPSYIRERMESEGYNGNECGYYDAQTRTVYVRQSRNDYTLPDFEIFGHEVFHSPELGGWFHK